MMVDPGSMNVSASMVSPCIEPFVIVIRSAEISIGSSAKSFRATSSRVFKWIASLGYSDSVRLSRSSILRVASASSPTGKALASGCPTAKS